MVVTPNWLDRLILCAESEDRIAFVNPLTNTAEQIALPMPPGSDFMDMYRRINHRIVKSTWLKNLLTKDGFEAYKIALGMDLDRFYPRDDTTDHPVVMAMARPKTPRRGFQTTIDASAQIKQASPETEIILFGDRFLRRYPIPFSYRDEGVVASQERLARLYSEADVFIDGSDFQGFGR